MSPTTAIAAEKIHLERLRAGAGDHVAPGACGVDCHAGAAGGGCSYAGATAKTGGAGDGATIVSGACTSPSAPLGG